MYNYSVIIPYRDKYNLFIKAVASVPDREDIQIIIADNSVEYLSKEEIPSKNKALVTYCQSSQTKGAGCARNEGLKHVRGRYILFVDADDYFTEDAFGTFDKFLNADNDITFFKPTSINLKTGLVSTRHLEYAKRIDLYLKNNDDALLRYRFEVPWSKLFRADFINNGQFRFEETRVCNDAWFSLQTGHNAKKIGISTETVYIVTEGEANTSLVKTKTKENQWIRYTSAVRTNIYLSKIGHNEVKIRLIGFIRIAYTNFGMREAVKYLTYAVKSRVNIL